MEQSRLIVAAQQGDPQAIASFLGNHLAVYSLWITATPNRHYLDLCLESLEPPTPIEILEPVQQLLCQLQPKNVERVQLSGRRYGEIQAQWQESFLLSQVTPQENFQTILPPPISRAIAGTGVTLQEPQTLQRQDLSTLNALVLATNQFLNPTGVAARMKLKGGLLKVELRSLKIPDQEHCLMVIYDLLHDVELLDINHLRIEAFIAKKLEPSWVEEVPLGEIFSPIKPFQMRAFVSLKEQEEFWLPLVFGASAGLLVFLIPICHTLFGILATLLVDLGEAVSHFLMGYLPIGLKNPLQGQGIITTTGRSPLLFGVSFGLWGLLLYRLRHRIRLAIAISTLALLHGLTYVSANLSALFLSLGGQVTLWSASSLLLYCALGGFSCQQRRRRGICMGFSTFLLLYTLMHHWQSWRVGSDGLNWLGFLGFVVTLLLPFGISKLYHRQKISLQTQCQ